MRWTAWLLLLVSACAHYRLPVSRVESPEVRGHPKPIRPAVIEPLALLSSSDLEANPSTSTNSETGITTTSLQTTFTPALGFWASLSERTDLGIRLAPQAPLSFRLKHQLSGAPLSQAREGNFAISILAAPGILFGSGGAGSSASLMVGDLSLLAGYRAWERHLFSLSPFFTFATASGLPVTGATQYGAALGYQYQYETLLLRLEVALASGSAGSASIGGMHLGLQMALALDSTPYPEETDSRR